MKKFISILLLVCLLSSALFSADNREFRATWSITWHQFASGLSADALKARTRAILDKHVEAGMNAVLWQVRQGGTVYYPSAYEPWGSYLGYTDPGYDPLAYAVEEAHKRGLELHAWFNTFHTSSSRAGTPAAEHPDWICRDGYGNAMRSNYCLSPGLKAVRDYTVAMVVELVQNYDIDGIHFDYVRWNEYDNTEAGILFAKQAEEMQLPDGVFPPGMEEYLERREAERQSLQKSAVPAPDNRYLYDIEHPEGSPVPDSTELYPDATPGAKFASIADWRRATLNVFIKEVHDTVQTIKPWVKVSPAALGRYRAASWNGYFSVFQDAARWFNEGWIDLLTPMSYHWLNATDMYNQLIGDWNPYISAGKNAGRPYSVGPASYLISNWNAHKGIIEVCRTLPWVRGFQFFSYGNWRDSQYPLESSHTVFASMTKQPSYHFLNTDVPAAPAAVLTKNSDISYTLEVTPDASLSEAQWFVIYRSEDANIDVNSDEIVKVVFADSAFSQEISFDGLQMQDQYYYGVTMNSRYWIESAPSNVVATDVIPMIAPKVTEHIPANTAVDVPNNQIVELHFNKSMDAESLSENLNITPAVANLSLQWANPTWVRDDHLILYISASWAFETTYTLTLGAATLDQSEMQIDGNGDGTGGDAFSISFSISGADEEAPVILATVPEEGDRAVDVDGVVTLQFNELLDRSSLENKFTLHYIGHRVYPGYSVFVTPEMKTYVTLKPNSMMASGADVTLSVAAGVSDTTGNQMAATELNFKTDSSYYSQRRMIENFTGTYTWERPGFSGSTSGINDSQSSSTLTGENYVQGYAADRSSLRMIVVPESEGWFARIYSANLNAVKNIDTSMSVQTYIFGDGSGYQFRIALAETGSASGNLFEVCEWITVDWTGWRLIEWDLKDPNQYGEWGGMTGGSLDGTSYSVNSLHLRGNPADPLATVTCYVDQLRSARLVEGLPAENLPPVIAELPDTSTMSAVAIYVNASYSDPNPGDNLSFTLLPDTAVFTLRYYSSEPGRVRILPAADYVGVSRMLAIVRDDGVGELADTAAFDLTVLFNTAVAGVPESFKVYPNYPNPFNPVTTFHFELPAPERVSIEIFNIRGQRVGELLNSELQAGTYHVKFDAAFLGSGVYFYKITAGTQVHVDRMTLLK
ncbi:MAG: family 10 glycosylhydrolase [bacterium]|jgi:uncharacterized lipoprotein YddW (UPF0748 family)|nr:family 10 glycosylhydrolase [bacterium]